MKETFKWKLDTLWTTLGNFSAFYLYLRWKFGIWDGLIGGALVLGMIIFFIMSGIESSREVS